MEIAMRVGLVALIVVALTAPGIAQTPASPYAGFADRQIKSLSRQQIADLQAGRGMGLAIAAELNGFPGPTHVLELADKLNLSPAQREAVRGLIGKMKADAVPLGERLIAQEGALDRQFSERTVTAATLEQSVAAIGATQASLRHAHLKYHLATLDMLTQKQVADYQRLRGYSADQGHNGHHRQH
jgi:hypothetical protein